jgi:hypothetical protein
MEHLERAHALAYLKLERLTGLGAEGVVLGNRPT